MQMGEENRLFLSNTCVFPVLVPFCKGGEYMCTHFIKIWDGCAKKHERNMGESKNHEWTLMDTNGQKQGLTTKDTKDTKREGRGRVRTTNGHEWTRMDKSRG